MDDPLALENQDVAFLFRGVRPGQNPTQAGLQGWGWAPMCWRDEIGSVRVTRRGHTPLQCMDVEIMCVFCRYFGPSFENSMAGGCEEMTKDEALAKITPTEYAAFAQRYKERKKKQKRVGRRSEGEISPTANPIISNFERD
ncbi:MAG: hypothetical protein Q9218_006923 [Villophora microphyllina]